MAAQGLVLFAFGPDMTAGTNLNVLSTPNMGLSLDFLEQANLAQVKALANGEVLSERVQLPAGEALHLRYALSTATGAPSPTIEQYMLINGANQLVVRMTKPPQAQRPQPDRRHQHDHPRGRVVGHRAVDRAASLGADRLERGRKADPGRATVSGEGRLRLERGGPAGRERAQTGESGPLD